MNLSHFRCMWVKRSETFYGHQAAEDAKGDESDPPLNRVTWPAGDNDIYARQVYDVWSATHELRVGRRRRRSKKRAVSSNVCSGWSREIRVLLEKRARLLASSAISKVSHIFNIAVTDLRADDTRRFIRYTARRTFTPTLVHFAVASRKSRIYWLSRGQLL